MKKIAAVISCSTQPGLRVRSQVLAAFILLTLCPSWVLASTPVAESCYQFDRYAAERVFHGPYAKPDMAHSREVRRFRSVIRQGAEGVPNFAGYLRVVSWGCGAGCQQFAIVNRKTGHTYLLPVAAEVGAKFQLDSRLFIVNPPEEVEGTLFNQPRAFVWDKQSESLQLLPGCDGNAKH